MKSEKENEQLPQSVEIDNKMEEDDNEVILVQVNENKKGCETKGIKSPKEDKNEE